MRKLLSLFTALLFVGITSMWADSYTWTMASGDLGTSDSPATSVTKGSPSTAWSIDWTWKDNSKKYLGFETQSPWRGLQIGKGTADYGGTTVVLSTSGISGTISAVSVNAAIPGSGGVTLSVKVGGTTYQYNNNNTASPTTTPENYNFTGSASGTIEITLVNNKTGKGMYIKSITVTYSSTPIVTHELAFAVNSSSSSFGTLSAKVGGSTILSGAELAVGTIVTFVPSPNAGYRVASITAVSSTIDSEYKMAMPDDDEYVEVVFEEIPTYTVSFSTGTGNPTQVSITETIGGEGITLPEGPTPACSTDGWSFAGWAEAEVASKTDVAPTLLSGTYYPANDVTLYAVYVKNEGTPFEGYTQVTSAPEDWTGKYLLSTGTKTATGEYDNGNHLTLATYTPSTEEKTAYEFTLTKVEDGEYSILLPDGDTYIGYDTKTNFKTSTTAPTSSDDSYLWAPSVSLITNVGTNDRKLYTNADQTDIRPYQNLQSGGAVVLLYKRGAGGSHYYYLSAPDCGGTTSIDNTEVDAKAVKVLRNGILLIEKNGHTYNAMGQLVK